MISKRLIVRARPAGSAQLTPAKAVARAMYLGAMQDLIEKRTAAVYGDLLPTPPAGSRPKRG